MADGLRRDHRWWWNRPENWRLIVKPYVLVTWVLVVVVTLALDVPWWASVLLTVGVPLALLGLAERYIRRAVAKRRSSAIPASTGRSPESGDD